MFSHHDISNMKRILFTILLLLLGSLAFSQHSSMAYRTLADSLYLHHHYQFAAGYYEKALKKSPHQGNIMLQLAKCYHKINLITESEKWFVKAKSNHGTFSKDDYYQFAQVLIFLKKKNQADSLLEHILQTDPNAHMARKSLADLRNFQQYYQDSAAVRVNSLSINSSVSEFAPVYYKEGIVFSSAKQEGPFRKKYHWDNSHFLNLYYAVKTADHRFGEPQLFEKELNTRHHDGPAMFYAQYQKMIINRNQRVKVEGREDVFEWRPGLYDAQFDQAKSSWQVTPLPFNESAYSYLHPSISEDGNILYFVSDKSGGYGGTDIYRVVRSGGVWGTPFNLGPVVNTAEDEAFPFFIDGTLYFASNGHGGLGGLDVFKCKQYVNGFTPPTNLGYPINSTADDFSLVTDLDQRNGYYASSRHGNDDLFSFQGVVTKMDILARLPSTPEIMNMAARVFRADNNQPLGNAHVKVITFSEIDQELTANAEGRVDFNLAQGTAYVVIGSKDNLTGMHSGMAERGTDKTFIIHPVPAYGDRPNEVLAIGLVTNTVGELIDVYRATVTNRATGSDISVQTEKGILTFLGERGKTYNIAVAHENYQTALQELSIPLTGPETEKFSVILENKFDGQEKKFPIVVNAGESELLVLDTEQGTSKMYIKSGESLTEITEKDSLLYLHTPRGSEYLGKGMLSNLRTDPSPVLKGLGLQQSDRTNLRNIYFDFDKATLDEEDKEYLKQVKKILEHDRSFKLLIAGHADDRGNENYNIRLSRRRAQAVSKYLTNQGIFKDRIIQKAFGESLPVVPCHTVDCSEEDHQKNRRAEFVLRSDTIQTSTPPLSKTSVLHKSDTMQYGALLETFSEKRIEGLSFKVSIGAYRKRPDLTFSELSDLGKIESVKEAGITYYSLSGFSTLKEVENVRHEVMRRGVKDASISIYQNGTKITLTNFIALNNNKSDSGR